MFTGKLLQISIIISLLTHGAILSRRPDFNLNAAQGKGKALEITYVKAPRESIPVMKVAVPKAEPLLKLSKNLTADKRVPPPYIDKGNVFKIDKALSARAPDFSKPAFIKSDFMGIKKKITLPPINLEKINNPSYTSYYQFMRERIKRSTYQNYNSSEVGEVTLAFLISRDGYLKDMRLADNDPSVSPTLKELALRSVKEASPFPRFPESLDYPELPFKLTIIFEVE